MKVSYPFFLTLCSSMLGTGMVASIFSTVGAGLATTVAVSCAGLVAFNVLFPAATLPPPPEPGTTVANLLTDLREALNSLDEYLPPEERESTLRTVGTAVRTAGRSAPQEGLSGFHNGESIPISFSERGNNETYNLSSLVGKRRLSARHRHSSHRCLGLKAHRASGDSKALRHIHWS